jgi:Flp pilus assembly protein TadG
MLRTVSRSVAAALSFAILQHRATARDRSAVTAIEFAIAAPVILAIGTGMIKFGVAMTHYLMLTYAAEQGATTIALSRGTATPYGTTTTAINNAAPSLTAASITKTIRLNGTACTSDATCSAALVAGQTAQVTLSYPCDLSVMGVDFKPSCSLSAQTAQMVQ